MTRYAILKAQPGQEPLPPPATRRYVTAILQPVPGQGPVPTELCNAYATHPWGPNGAAATGADAVSVAPASGTGVAPPAMVVSFGRATFASVDELTALVPSALNVGAEAFSGTSETAFGLARYVCDGHWHEPA